MSGIVRAWPDGDLVALLLDDGTTAHLSAAWLRDACTCPACRHPGGQRLRDVCLDADGLRAGGAVFDGAALAVRFEPGGHRSVFDAAVLAAALDPVPEPRRDVWDATLDPLPWHDHDAVADDPTARRAWLSDARRLGFALLAGVPRTPGAVARVAGLFGHVRRTNYGEVFDVRTVQGPRNLADTALGLGAHTDNPYRQPVPTLQLLHCLASSLRGGSTTLVDGLAVADALRRSDPRAWTLLASVPVRFRYADDEADLVADSPLLELDADGRVAALRFNTRSALPPAQPAARTARWYGAYRTLATLLGSPAYRIEIALRPGDLLLLDNRRVLHGRTAFDAAGGERHLQGCYADVDGLDSTLAVLARKEPSCATS